VTSENDYGDTGRSGIVERDGCGLGAAARRPRVIHEQDGWMSCHRLRSAVAVDEHGAALYRRVGTER